MQIGKLDTADRQRPYVVENSTHSPGLNSESTRVTYQRSALENAAAWMRSLRYEDMMQMATEMHGIKATDAIDTPEQLAKLLHSWAKATTEPTPQESR